MQVHGHRHGHYVLSQLQNFRQTQEQRFATADADGDGSLTQAEFEALGKTLPTGKGDTPAKVSASDIVAKFDADDSGNLDVDEIGRLLASRRGCSWACLLQAQEAEEAVAEETAVSETAESEEGSGGVAQPALANLFDKLDTDGDGSLSLDEFRALRPYHRHHGLLARLWLQEREVTPPSETTEAAEATETDAESSTTPVEETTA